MKKLLLLLTILFTFSAFAQKVDYDHTSKWFLGFNIGGAWQTTDVTNKTNLGYGLTLGKSYNYDYGRILSFDLRARYLTGKWRGQDFDTTDLSSYTIPGGILTDYKNNYGFTINNFETTVHRLGLELVIHANSFKDRTNIDPYIFGGIGLTWHQTYGDIIDFKSSQSGGLYNYDPSITYTQTELTTLMDGILDSPLDGSTLDKFRVGFMPSLGFGLGYQIGKYTTFGVEHKTTFTLIDDFDGYTKSSKYNDIYHYTSLYINFRFRTNNNVASNTTNYNTNSSGKIDTYTIGSNACPKPVIRLVYPSAASTTNVKSATYQLSTEITNVTSIQDISFTHNGIAIQNGNYNEQTKRFSASINLSAGLNTFEVIAKNQCGDAKSNFVINYSPCLQPTVSFTNPLTANGSTENVNYTLTANVSNIQNGQLTLKHNNFNITNYNYNASSGLVQATVSLSQGNNTFFIGGKNECGEATQTSSINYTFCASPIISFIQPTVDGTIVNSAIYNLNALIQNVNNGSIVLQLNNKTMPNPSFNKNTGTLLATLNLVVGMNTITIKSTNSCGTDAKTITIEYSPCLAPQITLVNPSNSISTANNQAFNLSALVQNTTNITLTKNGSTINYNHNNQTGSLQATTTLSQGVNTFVITAINTCGTDVETITVNYNPCVAPLISLVDPINTSSVTSNQTIKIAAIIQNSSNISLTKNGSTINYNFNSQSGSLQAATTLNQGVNTFVITAISPCGTDVETITVNYNPCTAPQVTLVNPSSSVTTALNQTFNLSALVQNSTNITLTKNGSSINYNFNSQTGSLQASTSLNQGVNTFVITAINTCGTDVETFTVNYNPCVAPQISLVDPINTSTLTSNQTINIAALIQNSSNISLTKNGSTINFNYNNQTETLQTTTALNQGVNTFIITAINTCGTDVETFTVNYNPCVAPQVTLVNPNDVNYTTNNQNLNLNSIVLNSSNITLTKNGSTINYNFNNQTGTLQAATTLNQGVNTFVITAINSCGTDVKTFTVNYNPCLAPQITLVNPSNANTTANNQAFNLSALVQNSSNITLTKNGTTINYNFNNQSGSLQAVTTLNQGVNTFVITAINSCGTDVKTFTVNYNPCVAPQITLIKPASPSSIAANENYTIAASLQNSTSVILTQNGIAINANFNNQTGTLQASTTLIQGTNTFVLTASNPCGTDVETFTLNFTSTPCVAPQITVVNPTQTPFIADNNSFNFSAIASSLVNASVTLTQNGNAVTNLTINQTTGTIQKNCTLITGSNIFVLTVTNACGRDSKTIEVNYNPCLKPVINFTLPNGTTVNNSQFNVTASIQHFTQIQYKIQTNTTQEGINFTHNGQTSYDYSFNSETGAFSCDATLTPGLNTFALTVTNPCGTTTATFTINYVICNKPTITAIQATKNSFNVSDSIFNFKAYLSGVNAKQNCQLKLNNQTISIFDFNSTTNLLSATFKLKIGLNQLNVKVTSNCGEEIQNFSINYSPLKPVVTPVRPKPSLPETKPSTPEIKPGGRGSGRNK